MKVKQLLDILSRCSLEAHVFLEPHNYDQEIVRVEYSDPKIREPNICNFKGIVWLSNAKDSMRKTETPQKIDGLDDDVFWIT